ncbi:hypothetical protein [uncultured Novosphingobium sp.]|uniref:hypothetical protein n=1 Tax=uncultured Novosphingobium sp. TaxID=292277 RepID=UPI00258F59ED|nr:hypothetical protein [uncultured Novosphingobium sp.]
MSQATDLTSHIQALIEADASLVSKLHKSWFYVGVPQTLPSVYIDGLYVTDDKQDTWRFNISFVTNDMSLNGLAIAQQVKAALQQSDCVLAQTIAVRPETENKRTRYLIPCSAYMRVLSQKP